MTALSKSALKALWKAYFQPTSADFSNLIDSWADYSPFIASFTAAVSGGSTGVVKAVSPTTAQFLPSGAFGESMLAATTTAAAQSILNIAYPVSVANGGTGVASLSANHVMLGNGTSAVQLVAPGASGNVLTSNGTTWESSPAASGKVVQQIYSSSTAYTTGTTTIPFDDTIPQNTEGTEFLTATITPTNTNNILVIEVQAIVSANNNVRVIGALFQDATANALNAVVWSNTGAVAGVRSGTIALRYQMAAGTTSSTTFRLRIGGDAATTIYFNGDNNTSARVFGGVCVSSIMITELTP